MKLKLLICIIRLFAEFVLMVFFDFAKTHDKKWIGTEIQLQLLIFKGKNLRGSVKFADKINRFAITDKVQNVTLNETYGPGSGRKMEQAKFISADSKKQYVFGTQVCKTDSAGA